MSYKIGFIGLGLIGGSIAKAFRKYYPDCEITVYNRSENSRIAALNDGVANTITGEVDSNFSNCDYIFLCTPVEQNITYLTTLKEIIKDSCIITDVGSVKSNIHECITSLGMTSNFIGGHPMAGSEKTSYFNSSADIIKDSYYVLTPCKDTDESKLKELTEIVGNLKSIPVVLDYKQHDFIVAGISHVPHLIASNLVNMIEDSDDTDKHMKQLAAGGFKDITRIASSSAEMWSQICSVNKDNIASIIDTYIEYLEKTKEAVINNDSDYIKELFVKSKAYRDSI